MVLALPTTLSYVGTKAGSSMWRPQASPTSGDILRALSKAHRSSCSKAGRSAAGFPHSLPGFLPPSNSRPLGPRPCPSLMRLHWSVPSGSGDGAEPEGDYLLHGVQEPIPVPTSRGSSSSLHSALLLYTAYIQCPRLRLHCLCFSVHMLTQACDLQFHTTCTTLKSTLPALWTPSPSTAFPTPPSAPTVLTRHPHQHPSCTPLGSE